jgi:hypothetical protein
MNEFCRTTPVASASLADDKAGMIVINFPRDNFLLLQTVVGVTCSVYAFKEFVEGNIDASIIIILIGVAIILARAKFKTRPPEWALVDPVNRILRLKQRWPKNSEIEFDISKLKSVEAHVPRFQRFPVTLLNLHFEEMERVSIIFDVESNETRFFATPNEVVPPSVEELVKVIQKFIIEKEESK